MRCFSAMRYHFAFSYSLHLCIFSYFFYVYDKDRNIIWLSKLLQITPVQAGFHSEKILQITNRWLRHARYDAIQDISQDGKLNLFQENFIIVKNQTLKKKKSRASTSFVQFNLSLFKKLEGYFVITSYTIFKVRQ